MGIELKLEQITSKQLDGFIQTPSAAYEYVLSDMFENPDMTEFLNMIAKQEQSLAPEARANRDRLAGMLPLERPKENGGNLQLLRRHIGPKQRKRKAVKRRQFLLEKDWHVLHYSLNGTAEGGDGLASTILGGTEMPDVEGVMGYGPMRYLTPTEVKSASRALATVNEKELASRLNKRDAEARHIYLAHTIDTAGEWDNLQELFRGFRAFYSDAARRGNAILMVMY